MDIPLIAVGLVAMPAIYFCNKLARRKKEVDHATDCMNTALQDRYDLIPEIVDTLKSHMYYECDALIKLTRIHARALSFHTQDVKKLELNSEITNVLKQVMGEVDNYPQLRSGNSFLQLQRKWMVVEATLARCGNVYNHAVLEYNNAINGFPENMFADLLGYKTKTTFEVPQQGFITLKPQQLFYN